MLKKLLTLTLSLLLVFSVIPMALVSAEGTTYTYVAYDNMSDNMNSGSTGTPMTTETDAMSITVNGGLLTKFAGYISGYNYAQWQSSTNNINLTFGLKGVETGVYTLTIYTADNNQARGSFDITAASNDDPTQAPTEATTKHDPYESDKW